MSSDNARGLELRPHTSDSGTQIYFRANIQPSLADSTAFDEGAYTHDPVAAAEEVIATLAVLDNLHPSVDAEAQPVRHALQSCWQRFCKLAHPQLQYRWKKQLTTYAVGVLQQVGVQARTAAAEKEGRVSKPLTIEEYMEYRAGCVGAYPCLGLME